MSEKSQEYLNSVDVEFVKKFNSDQTEVVFDPEDFNDAIDFELDEMECLKRYYSVYRTILLYKVCKPIKEEGFTEADIGKNIQGSLVDWCVAHALEGDKNIEEIQMNAQYTVLQAALILTITIPLYINPPGMADETTNNAFSAFVGFSAFFHIAVIIGCTIFAMILNRPYSPADTLCARIEYFNLFAMVNVANYIAVSTAIIATLIAGFDRSWIDGFVQIYSPFLILTILYIFISGYGSGTQAQDRRVYRFYKKYCEKNGQLKEKYLRAVVIHNKKAFLTSKDD